MQYMAVTTNKIYKAPTLALLNKKMDAGFTEEDFKTRGKDKICIVGDQDLMFVKDLKRMSLIPMAKLYKEDNTKTLFVIMLVLQLITLIRAGG